MFSKMFCAISAILLHSNCGEGKVQQRKERVDMNGTLRLKYSYIFFPSKVYKNPLFIRFQKNKLIN